MKGDILACYGFDTISELVEKITKSNVAHIAVQVSDKFIMESSWFGVKLSKLSSKNGQYFILRDNALTPEQRQAIVDFVMNSVDVKFDYKQFFGAGMAKLFGIPNKWDDKDKYICDELAIHAYRSLGIEILPGMVDKDVVPGDLLISDRFIIIKCEDETLL